MNNRISRSMLLILLILAALSWACQTGDRPRKVDQASPADIQTGMEPQDPPGPFQVGDVISTGDTLVVVLGWSVPPGGDFNPPDAGKKYIAVDVLLANQGESPFSVSPLLQMTLKDGQSQKFNVSGKANAATKSSPPNGEISPGERLRGTVGFQVPDGTNHFYFVYEEKLIGLGEVTVDLGSVPLSVDPPADLGLTRSQDVFQIGDVVQISDLAVQVVGVQVSQGGSVVQPDPDARFVIVDVVVENRGERTREISSGLQMYLKDHSSQKYTLHLGAQTFADTGLPDDELQPGERVRGQIGFQVPETARGLTFVFDVNIVGYGKAQIALP